jgi:hypothetical protein
MRSLIALFLMLLSGCATNDYYNAQRDQIAAWERVEIARAQAFGRKYDALAQYARTADSHAQIAAVLALNAERPVQVPPPVLANPSDEAYRWASILLPTVTNIASVGFGYKLGTVQSNNATLQTQASYGAIASVASQGFGAVSSIGSQIQAPAPNVTTTTTNTNTYTLSGTGVLGSGTYTRNCSSGYNLGNPTNPLTMIGGNC